MLSKTEATLEFIKLSSSVIVHSSHSPHAVFAADATFPSPCISFLLYNLLARTKGSDVDVVISENEIARRAPKSHKYIWTRVSGSVRLERCTRTTDHPPLSIQLPNSRSIHTPWRSSCSPDVWMSVLLSINITGCISFPSLLVINSRIGLCHLKVDRIPYIKCSKCQSCRLNYKQPKDKSHPVLSKITF